MRFKNFVEKTKVAQDRDVDELPGTQPSKYYSGVDKDDKEKRAKQFARQAKMSDDDPKAYKPAPGDKGTETKPSKYTKKFKQMYGEDWSKEYKDSIDCNNPKGFSQRAHCAGKKKNEDAPRWIKDLIGNKMHPKQYKKAEELLRDLIARKKKEAGKKGLRHSIEYYAAQIARNFSDVDARNLARMVQEDEDPCWNGYKQVGMKKKNGKMVPNCVQEARAKQAVAGNKVQKLVTGFGMSYKGKKYDEIDFELVGIDNNTQMVTFKILHPKEHIGDEVKIPFKTLRRGRFMATDTSKINEEVSQKQLDDLEKFADRLLAKFKVDVEFTKHFKDRMNDKRNSPEIKVVELQKLFKKIQKNKAKNIQGNAGLEAVLKDLSSDLNLPVVIKQKGDEIELVNKTIMRKSDFKTTSKIIKYEEFTNMDEASRADMRIRKRPHMMLKAGNAGVKFDGRFKMFKKKQLLQDDEKPLEESYESIEEQIFGLMESTESLFEDPNKALQNKADKSGIKKSILKKVYDRGVAAWRTGHRPGTTPEQWGLARVNSFITGGKTRTTADADLWKQRNEEMDEEKDFEKILTTDGRVRAFKEKLKKLGYAKSSMDEGKSSTGYELYHKDFSSAMQHAYKHAKDKLKVDIDPEEIDNKVASGPRKPSKGKTNSYRLLDKDGKKAVQIQVYNMDNKRYELNMYKESRDFDSEFEALVEEDLQENAKIKKAIDNAHKFFVKTSKGKNEKVQEKNRFAALEMLKKELEKAGVGERDMMKAFGELDNHIIKVMDESVELDELSPETMSRYHSAAEKSKSRAWAKFDLGKTTAAAAHKNQEKRTAGQKLARKKINQKAFRPTKEEVNLEEKVNVKAIQKAVDDGKSMDVIMTMFANKRTTNTDEIRKVVKDYMWKKRMKKEEVELEENMSRVAKELEDYARKNGGIDKMDFMKAAMMMKKGQTNQLKKFVDDLDTEPREKILSLMQKDADRRKDYKSFQKAKRNEEVELEEKFSPKEIKMAIGIASDKRYKGGNMTGAVQAIEKIKKGLSNDKQVSAVLRKQNEQFELEEGVNDPGIFKAVFLAGGPGSGKSFMVGKTALTTLGLKLINSDPAFEAQLKKAGLKATPEDIFTDKGQDARAKAKRLTAKQQELALKGRLGLVIDGTGKDYDKIQKQAIDLRKMGYEVAMIFVNTNLKTAIDRDAKRDRTLGAKEVTKMWNQVQDNIGKFQKFFGDMMVIVDNSDGSDWQTGTMTAYKKMQKWVGKEPKSPMAKKWIDSQKKQRGITEEDSKKLEESKKPLEYGTQETTDTFKKVTPGEGAPQRFSQRIRESILRSRRRR